MPRRLSPALLARVESLLWDDHDEHAKADGLQVARVGRWQRRYRNPRITIALAAAASRAADDDGGGPTAPAYLMERAA